MCADKIWKVTWQGLPTVGGRSVPGGTERLNDLPVVTCLGMKGVCCGLGLLDSHLFSAGCIGAGTSTVHDPCGGSGNRCEDPIKGDCVLVKCGFVFVQGLSKRQVGPKGQRLLASGELRCGEGSPGANNLASVPRCSGSFAPK